MNTPWGAIIDGIGGIADDLITTEEERMKLALQGRELDLRQNEGQMKVNAVEAAHPSRFVAGGRPAVIWVGAIALAWTFIVHPMLMWAWSLSQAKGWIPADFQPPPTLGSDALWVILSGLLGVGGMRSFDKVKGTDTKRISSAPMEPGQIGGP